MVVRQEQYAISDRALHKKKVFTSVLNTPDGLCFLKYLIEDVLYKSSFDKESVYSTHVNIGEDNFIRNLIKYVVDQSVLDRTETVKIKLKKGT